MLHTGNLHVAKLPHQLTKKGEPWHWSGTEEDAFREWKDYTSASPCATGPDGTIPT